MIAFLELLRAALQPLLFWLAVALQPATRLYVFGVPFMKKFPAGLCVSLLLALQGVMPTLRTQEITNATIPASRAGPEFHPVINQQTNPVVTAREVKLTEQGRSSRPYLVVFNNETKEVLAGCATNRTCLLRGRFFQVDPGQQGFFVTVSKPLGANQLTEQKAIEFAWQAFHAEPSSRLHLEPGTKYMDLRELLKQERELRLANLLILPEVSIRPEGSNLLVNFVSATGLRGKVTLDQQLNVLSTTLADSKK